MITESEISTSIATANIKAFYLNEIFKYLIGHPQMSGNKFKKSQISRKENLEDFSNLGRLNIYGKIEDESNR